MFETRRRQENKEGNILKRWGTAFAAALCVAGFSMGKNVSAQEITPKQVVDLSNQTPKQEQLLSSDKLEFLKTAPTKEEQEKIDKLRARLKNISKKNVLSVPEVTRTLSPKPDQVGGSIYSGVQTLNTETNAYFLEKEENPYTDIITENSTTEFTAGVQNNSVIQETKIPVTKGIMTVESIVATEDEDGEFRSVLRQRSGYINSDGSVNDVPVDGQSEVNRPESANHSRGDVIPKSVIQSFKQPGAASRELYNQHGYVVQGKSFEGIGSPSTKISKDTEYSVGASHTKTIKHTHSNHEKTVVRESVRRVGYDSNTSNTANAALNTGAIAIPSPLKRDLNTAKQQSQVRMQSGQSPTKRAKIHKPEILEKLRKLKLETNKGITPSIEESKLQSTASQNKGSFVGVDVGTENIIRSETKFSTKRSKDSNFKNQFRVGLENDFGTSNEVVINGQDRSKDAFVGIQFGLDTSSYDITSTRKDISHNMKELSAGVSTGIVRGKVSGSGRVSVNHDHLNNKVYPKALTKAELDLGKTKLNAQARYSTNTPISQPNEARVSLSHTEKLAKKTTASLYGYKTVGLGNNHDTYKTQSAVGAKVNINNKVSVGGEYYPGNGETSDKGYLINTVLKQNWGTIYANISKINDTKNIGGGVKTKINKKTELDLSYQKQSSPNPLFNDSTVKFMIRNKF